MSASDTRTDEVPDATAMSQRAAADRSDSIVRSIVDGGEADTTMVDTQFGSAGGAVPPTTIVTATGGASSSTGEPKTQTTDVLVEDDRPHRKVALVGYTSSRLEAPYDDPSWELWGMNNLHGHPDMEPRVGRFARWYNLHDLTELLKPDDQGGDAKHLAWLREPHPFPIYAMDPLEGVDVDLAGEKVKPLAERAGMPSLVPFPKALLLSQFMPYFTNTVSWQIAHLLWEAACDESYVLTDLALFGIDMAVGTEYAHQRPSVEFFIGLAQGLGVNITLPESSDLCKAADVYGGADDKSGMRAKIALRLKELHEQKTHIENQVAQAQSIHASVCGAIDSLAYVQGVWLPPTQSASARDAVVVPAGSLSPVAQMLAEGTAKERHADVEAKHGQ